MPDGLVREANEVDPPETAGFVTRDVRARKAPIRSALIRWETARRVARVVTLSALDAAGVFLAIWTALELKALLNGKSNLHLSFGQTKDVAPLAILVTVLLFALSD